VVFHHFSRSIEPPTLRNRNGRVVLPLSNQDVAAATDPEFL
jgi:hypothetical protein